MSIEYAVGLNCPVKEVLSLPKLVSLIKKESQAHAALTRARDTGDLRPPSEILFIKRLQQPQGFVDEEFSIQSLLDEAEELKSYKHYCMGCPANVWNLPFGCYGSVKYPIEVVTEKWLLSLLPNDLDSPIGMLLRSATKDLGYMGHPFIEMRKQKLFFEGKEPLKRQWDKGEVNWECNVDQLLEMMFAVGNLQPSHCHLLALFLGMLPRDLEPQHLSDFAMQKTILAEVAITSQDTQGQIYDFVCFLNAVRVAAVEGVELWIDY